MVGGEARKRPDYRLPLVPQRTATLPTHSLPNRGAIGSSAEGLVREGVKRVAGRDISPPTFILSENLKLKKRPCRASTETSATTPTFSWYHASLSKPISSCEYPTRSF